MASSKFGANRASRGRRYELISSLAKWTKSNHPDSDLLRHYTDAMEIQRHTNDKNVVLNTLEKCEKIAVLHEAADQAIKKKVSGDKKKHFIPGKTSQQAAKITKRLDQMTDNSEEWADNMTEYISRLNEHVTPDGWINNYSQSSDSDE